MNTQDKIWTILNQIHELRLQISTSDNINYNILYQQLEDLEKEYRTLNNNECD